MFSFIGTLDAARVTVDLWRPEPHALGDWAARVRLTGPYTLDKLIFGVSAVQARGLALSLCHTLFEGHVLRDAHGRFARLPGRRG